MNREALTKEGYELFSVFSRPQHFHEHSNTDPESADHESKLQSISRETLALNDVASIGYNPITGINAEGMAYFMPRLVELALDLQTKSIHEQEPYLWGFILQIMPSEDWERFVLFGKTHFAFICKVLRAIWQEHEEYIRNQCFENDYQTTLEAWCEKGV